MVVQRETRLHHALIIFSHAFSAIATKHMDVKLLAELLRPPEEGEEDDDVRAL